MYKVPQKKHRLKGEKKRKNKKNDPKFTWMRQEIPECLICGDLGEVHHLDFGANADDARVVMLCYRHHSAQSNTGLHKDPAGWYNTFIPFVELEAKAYEVDSDFYDYLFSQGKI